MSPELKPRIVIEDQGPRDGFQSESVIVPTARKVEVVAALVEAGVKRIQVTSFVHPSYVPQMADAEQLCAQLPRADQVIYSGLVLNGRGIDRAIAAGLRHVAISHSASDTHSRKNTRRSLQEARQGHAENVMRAQQAGLTVRGGVQCAFGCRYEGPITAATVLEMVEAQLALGVDEIALADSTGMGDPRAIRNLLPQVLKLARGRPVFLHLHDTEGRGMANALAAIDLGVRHFDTAFGGMGGCPYIRGASGNIATEDLVAMAQQMGFETGIDARKVAEVSTLMEEFYDRPFPGKMHRVLSTPGLATLA
ncbi:MAG: hydroxymethylglutaryl-CoA lyase [Rickettsiales bacterium]|nr:hydroxymethylglutaryl-CoA lyase [Rickettsiales bacterium]